MFLLNKCLCLFNVSKIILFIIFKILIEILFKNVDWNIYLFL